MSSVKHEEKLGGFHVLVWTCLTVLVCMMMASPQVHAVTPLLMQAQSLMDHGTVGPFALDVDPFSAAECRQGGPTRLRITFDRAVQGVGGLGLDDVTVSSGTVTGVAIDGGTLTIDMAGGADGVRLNVAFPGIADGDDANSVVEDVLCFGVLAGDANGDAAVNIFDLIAIRNQLNQPVTEANFHHDVNADGLVNIFDMIATRNNLNNTIDGICTGDVVPRMALIPAGDFLMGDSFSEGSTVERPVHPVYVDAFYISRTEVTNEQYATALNWANSQGLVSVSGGAVYDSTGSFLYCDTTASTSYSRITWNGSTFGVVAGKEQHPMVMVNWYGSVAYANWRSAMQGRPLCYDLSTWNCNYAAAGYRLPTEAEWEKAARGGSAGRRFPWSDQDTIQHSRCNYYSSTSYAYDTSPTRGYHPLWGVSPYPYTSPVGFFDGSLRYKVDSNWPGSPTSYQTANGANGYGLYNMAGNVWEWCTDWYSGTYYSTTPYPHVNPLGPTSGTSRIMRGGYWELGASACRVAHRHYNIPTHRDGNYGLRLVGSAGN